MMKDVLLTVTGIGRAPTVEEAARQLSVDALAIDQAFGVVPIDPANNLYCVLVRDEAAGDLERHCNPRIKPANDAAG
jgi:hypothetical protein